MQETFVFILHLIVVSTTCHGQIIWTFENDAPLRNHTKLDMTSSAQLQTLDKTLGFCKTVNLLETTILELQKALSTGILTSVDICQCYIRRIQLMDPYLRSVLELNPDAVKIAQEMDEVRKTGESLELMYGIPILVKDNIATGDDMETTAGSMALMGIRPKIDSNVVKLLRKAGAIILGKTNMDEFAL